MPYLNPDNIPLPNAANYRGICVLVPDYPEYRIALLGSLNYLAQWTAWERDDQQSAVKSANLWKLANETTKLNWQNQCGEDDMAFDCEAMKDCLIEVARAISVNVTVNNSCGGSGGGSGTLYCVNEDGDIIVNPPPVSDTPLEPGLPLPPGMESPPVIVPDEGDPPDGFDDWESYNTSACIAANTVWQWAMNSLLFIKELLTERIYQITTIFALIVNYLLGGIGLVFSTPMMLKIAELYAKLYTWLDPFTEAVDLAIADLIANKQEYICWMYTHRGNMAEWETDLITKLFNASSGGLLENTNQPLWKDLLSYLIPPLTGLNIAYGSITYDGDKTGFVSCDTCGSGSRFDLYPIDETAVSGAGVTPVLLDNIVEWTGNQVNGHVYFESASLNLPTGYELRGLYFELTQVGGQYYCEKNGGGNHIFGNLNQKVFITTWYLTQDQEYLDWVATYDGLLLDQPDGLWNPHTNTDVWSWNYATTKAKVFWVVENTNI